MSASSKCTNGRIFRHLNVAHPGEDSNCGPQRCHPWPLRLHRDERYVVKEAGLGENPRLLWRCPLAPTALVPAMFVTSSQKTGHMDVGVQISGYRLEGLGTCQTKADHHTQERAKVKFLHQELPEDGAFITAQIAKSRKLLRCQDVESYF